MTTKVSKSLQSTNSLCSLTWILVEIGAYYEPSLLPDFSTETFHLVKDKLVQHDFRDIDDELIPAWQIEKALRPGTIILVSAVLHVYNIKIKNSTNFRQVCTSHMPQILLS